MNRLTTALLPSLVPTPCGRVETLRSDALPEAQRALEQARCGYERGRFSYLELATAQLELPVLRAEIERLTNAPLGLKAP